MNHPLFLVPLTILVLAVQGGVANAQSRLRSSVEMTPGGYAKVSTRDPEVVRAVKFAVKEQSKNGKAISLKSITAAYQQVVAGMNYQVELVVEEAGKQRKAEAVIYQDLKQQYQLTSWVWK